MQQQSFIAQTRLVKRQGVIPKVNVITVQSSHSLCTIMLINLRFGLLRSTTSQVMLIMVFRTGGNIPHRRPADDDLAHFSHFVRRV